MNTCFLYFMICMGFFVRSGFFSEIEWTNCQESFYSLPKCIDQPSGYYCNCGPGFIWNSKLCIAAGVDSQMTFSSNNISFTYVERESIEKQFTISLWVKPRQDGTILAFVSQSIRPVVSYLRIQLKLTPGMKFVPTVYFRNITWTVLTLLSFDKWSHIVWTQKIVSFGTVQWIIYINNVSYKKAVAIRPTQIQGDLILGQYTKEKKNGDGNSQGFGGEITHVNLWNYCMSSKQVKHLHDDCTYSYCGNSVQWTQFRYGTQGGLQMKWPSGLKSSRCKDTQTLIKSCDSHCSRRMGAQCKEQILWNVLWKRNRANETVRIPCSMLGGETESGGANVNNKTTTTTVISAANGGQSTVVQMITDGSSSMQQQQQQQQYLLTDDYSIKPTISDSITRLCRELSVTDSQWEAPKIAQCILGDIKNLLTKVESVTKEMERCHLDDATILSTLEYFANLTSRIQLRNAIDLSLCVKTLSTLLTLKERQIAQCPRFLMEMSEQRDKVYRNHFALVKITLKITSTLLSSKNAVAWNFTRPAGHEGLQLLQLMHTFHQQIADSSVNIINKYYFMPREMSRIFHYPQITMKISAYQWYHFRGFVFPELGDYQYLDKEKVTLVLDANMRKRTVQKLHMETTPGYIVIVSVFYHQITNRVPFAASVHDLKQRTGDVQRKRQKVNSDVVDIAVSFDGQAVSKINAESLRIHFTYHNNFNLSNTACRKLSGNAMERDIYSPQLLRWKKSCQRGKTTSKGTQCNCDTVGIFSVTTNMYNDLWNSDKKRPRLLAVPSYFGCIVAAFLCGGTVVMLCYMGTSSNTSAIHKNFSIAIVAALFTYMFGIDKYEYRIICKSFSLLLHYFFLSCFAWLMNEAFNLYIVVTYAAHSHGDSTDGPMWRFHLLGWIMPAALVSAVAGINKDDYYATEMCWINRKDVWLFYGPAIAMILVSILVLIFTAKEHHESSYTKNEKDNKAIINQTKAVWTQIILQSLAWSFAFISVLMQGIIVKCLYGLFNCLLGMFYVMFYYLLNDEVQKLYSEKTKQTPSTHDGPYARYNDSFRSVTEAQYCTEEGSNVTRSRGRNFIGNIIENINFGPKSRSPKYTDDDVKNNDDSDFELITSV